MIKLLTNIFLILFLTSGLMAQDNKREWTEGKLSWEDFSEKKGTQRVSELIYFLGYNTEKQKFGDTTIIRNVASCYMDKKLSWINPEFKREQYLRFNQVNFDIVEIHRRKLQYELDRMNSFFEIEGTFNHIYNSCKTEVVKFQKESNGGQDLNSIILWEKKIVDELEIYSDTKIPEFKIGNFGYGLHGGFGSGIFTGSIAEHFTPNFNLMYGFDIAYKKSILFLNASLGANKVKKDYISDEKWYKGQPANVAIIEFNYGYALIDNSNLKLSPFAGLGITEFSVDNRDNDEDILREVDYNLVFGINADFKLRTILRFVPFPLLGVKERAETSLRTRLYIARANYDEDLQGYSINLSLSFCSFGNFIRLK